MVQLSPSSWAASLWVGATFSSRSLPPSPFGWRCVLPPPLLRLGGGASPPPATFQTHPQCQFTTDANIKRGGGKQCHTKRREGKATDRPKGESNATQKERREQQRHPKERGGKAATPRREEEWEATHSKEEGKTAPPREGCASLRLFGLVLLSLRWCCRPPSFFGCGAAVLPWVALFLLTALGGAG